MNWKQVRLCIAIPSARGIQPEVMGSVIALFHELARRGGQVSFESSKAPSAAMARGHLAHGFRHSDGTHILYVDDDVQFDPRSIVRMLERDVQVIGAAYRQKTQDPRHLQFVVAVGNEQMTQKDVDGTIRVQKLGGGLLLIQRHVIEQLDEAHKDLRFEWGPNVQCLGIFNEFVLDHRLQTDDWAFCLRWRALGGELWCLLDAQTTHISGGLAWPGNFLDVWNARHQLAATADPYERAGAVVIAPPLHTPTADEIARFRHAP